MSRSDDLDPLIRVRKHTVEQKQKILAELYRKVEALETQKQDILKKMEEEQKTVQQLDVQMLSYFGPYTDAVHDRVEEIDTARAALNKRIDVAREDVRAAFAELKKIEITQRNRADEERAEEKRKEDLVMDEVALGAYQRGLDTDSSS